MNSPTLVTPAAAPPRSSALRVLMWTLLVFGVLVALALGALVAGIATLADQMNLVVNGVPIKIGAVHGGHVLLVIGAVMVAAMIIVIVVPAALLLGLLGMLLATLVTLSPLLAAGALVWLLLRPKPDTAAAAPGATMPP
ncbi:MAG: hypothetical protein Q8N44_02345 [Rubrivivax sp.]|nr:hypothetical protein [Rubrivivax sp.]MDP3082521.1 hypothetical protein [Rubrivivax sp.]